MKSPYRHTLAYRGESFVSQRPAKSTDTKLDEKDKKALLDALNPFSKKERKNAE